MLVNAEERNKQFTGVKAVITGKPGIGKTTCTLCLANNFNAFLKSSFILHLPIGFVQKPL